MPELNYDTVILLITIINSNAVHSKIVTICLPFFYFTKI